MVVASGEVQKPNCQHETSEGRGCIFGRRTAKGASTYVTFILGVGFPPKKAAEVLGPKLLFVTGLAIFVTAVARLVCPDLLG